MLTPFVAALSSLQSPLLPPSRALAAALQSNQTMPEVSDACGDGSPYNGNLGLRVGAIFVILSTSMMGTLFPIVMRRVKRVGVPETVYEFVKYFGSGVIIATAWTEYSWTPAIAMFSVYCIFIVELIAHRAGAAYLRRQGLKTHDHHNADRSDIAHTTHGAHVEERSPATTLSAAEVGGNLSDGDVKPSGDSEHGHHHHDNEHLSESAMASILGTAILEFGVIFHSLIIGLTLAVVDDFATLFVVLVFHQMFEGLGLGSRLSTLPLPSRLSWVPFAGAILYSCITPLGIAIGLAVRTSYNPDSATALIVAGVLDGLSAGILLYTGLVELLAHDFIFNRAMAVDASNTKVAASV
ncbi:hypothetical protein RQP46_009401 [Phenoliferia psychrophenolica]